MTIEPWRLAQMRAEQQPKKLKPAAPMEPLTAAQVRSVKATLGAFATKTLAANKARRAERAKARAAAAKKESK